MKPESSFASQANPNLMKQDVEVRRAAVWDIALQTNPDLVYKAASRGWKYAQRAVIKWEANQALWGKDLKTDTNTPTPIFDSLTFPQSEETKAEWDDLVRIDLKLMQKIAGNNRHAAAALARHTETKSTISNPNIGPTNPDHGAISRIIINKNPFSHDIETKITEWAEIEKKQKVVEQFFLMEACFIGYNLVAGGASKPPVNYMDAFHGLLLTRNTSPALLDLYMLPERPERPPLLREEDVNNMRLIGVHSARLLQTPIEIIETIENLSQNSKLIERMKKIYQESKTVEELDQAIAERRYGFPNPRIK